jgi:hypothetical protein
MHRVILFLGLCGWSQAVLAAELSRPNILFIFSDDHAQHAISAYGSTVNKTPHLDRLAAEGATFAHSFVTNSICTPSRATLLTGQYSHANGVPVFNRFDGSRDTVAKHLQPASIAGSSCPARAPTGIRSSSRPAASLRSPAIPRRSSGVWASSFCRPGRPTSLFFSCCTIRHRTVPGSRTTAIGRGSRMR